MNHIEETLDSLVGTWVGVSIRFWHQEVDIKFGVLAKEGNHYHVSHPDYVFGAENVARVVVGDLIKIVLPLRTYRLRG
jgi:hypothetical protein